MAAAACPRVAALSPWRASQAACRGLLSLPAAARFARLPSGASLTTGAHVTPSTAGSLRRPSPIVPCRSLLVCRRPSCASFSSSGPLSDQSTAPTNSSIPSPRFSYHVAASFTAKDRPYDPSTHVFHFNPYNRIQQPARNRKRSSRLDSGHDAFFVSRVDDSGAVAFGVADGVGGWTDSGVDPADFSHGLCDYMAAAAYQYNLAATSHPPATLTARSLMHKGYEAVCHDPTVKAGGSTACVAIGAPDGSLDVANLGDSGFLQLRLNGIHAFSSPQIHDFNTPYQLSLVPPPMAVRTAAFGGNQLQDLPRDADVNQYHLRHGDILVFATDGVLDNLFNQEILRIASRVMLSAGAWTITAAGGIGVTDALDALVQPVAGPAELKTSSLQSLLATELVTAAKRASMNTKVDGPFAKQVRKHYPHERWHGGKVDDICAVVVVCESSLGDGNSRL